MVKNPNTMKKQFLFPVVLFVSCVIAFSSCQKEENNNNNTIPPETEAKAQSDDQHFFSTGIDALANDANLMLESSGAFSGRGQGIQSLICDATVVVDTTSNPRTLTITYNGTNCIGVYTRTGVVTLSMAQNVHWKDVGAQISVNVQNLKITRLIDNKSITINGAQTYTNQSGGLLLFLPTLNTITHLINSDGISVKFDDNTQRTWKVARKHVFTYSNGVVLTVSGNHSENGVDNISEWGTNRFGGAFTTSTTVPLVIRQDCYFRITAGEVLHTTPHITASVIFGLDENGNPASCPGIGLYYMKLNWAITGGSTHSLILPY